METGPLPGVTRDNEVFEGNLFSVTRGDYSPLLKLVVDELRKAQVINLNSFHVSMRHVRHKCLQNFASNEVEVAMLEEYIKSFTSGRLDDHKNGSRHWVKNKGPIIET